MTSQITSTTDANLQSETDLTAIEEQLDAIFGKPKELNAEEQKQVDALNNQIDQLLDSSEDKDLTADQEKELDGLLQQIDTLYGVKSYDNLTDAEKTQADALFEKLDEIEGEDEAEFEEEDSLETVNPEVEALYGQLDAIFGTPKELNAEEQKQADAIDAQITKLFEDAGDKELSEADEAKLVELETQLDTLYGVKSYGSLTDEEKKSVDEIYSKIEEAEGSESEDGFTVDAETEALFKQLDDIFGTPKELNAEEQQQADAIDAQLTKLFEDAGDKELSEADEAKLVELETQLDALYGVKSYASLTDEEKKAVDDIFEKLDAKEEGAFADDDELVSFEGFESLDDDGENGEFNFGEDDSEGGTYDFMSMFEGWGEMSEGESGESDSEFGDDTDSFGSFEGFGEDNLQLTGQYDSMESMDFFM